MLSLHSSSISSIKASSKWEREQKSERRRLRAPDCAIPNQQLCVKARKDSRSYRVRSNISYCRATIEGAQQGLEAGGRRVREKLCVVSFVPLRR